MAHRMLMIARMIRFALTVTVLLAATATSASAGGYLGIGIGTSPPGAGDYGFVGDGRSGRLELGYSLGRLAIEGSGTKLGLHSNDGYVYGGVSLGLAGKYNIPLGDHFEAFGRL